MANNIYSQEHRIRPAARHILTIGKGIIKDNATAVLELVKNAYDADATKVDIDFQIIKDKSGVEKFKITINDDGHGMDLDTILGKWLVPSTDNKKKQATSPQGRVMQGKKGIGRYAVSILGDDFMIETVDKNTKQETVVVINWREFENPQYTYLDEVPILVDSYDNSQKLQGTKLTIISNNIWNVIEMDDLSLELRKLISPLTYKENDFDVWCHFINYSYGNEMDKKIEPLPVLEWYHYRIVGTIEQLENKDTGKNEIIAQFDYFNDYIGSNIKESIVKKIELSDKHEYCGKINFDIRVLDLDKEGFDNIYKRTQMDTKQAKEMIEEMSGMGLYRGDFRIRPYGDKEYDWLGLNKRRVNNPTLRLSTNQAIGIINVLGEDVSKLEEKATREGLKENEAYEGLKEVLITVIAELEQRKFQFRKTMEMGRKSADTQEELKEMSDLTSLKENVLKELKKANVSDSVINNVISSVIKAEAEKKKQAATITTLIAKKEQKTNNVIATYQAQASLGKILTVVLHEGRSPLSYLKEQGTNLLFNIKKLGKEIEIRFHINDQNISEISQKLQKQAEGIKNQSESIIRLFKKIEPLAITNRGKAKDLDLITIIKQTKEIFNHELETNNIVLELNIIEVAMIRGWQEDLMAVFTNLIENSIYWLNQTNKTNKTIQIDVKESSTNIIIDLKDNGQGISLEHIENQIIFEPNFTTKTNGTGLGLAISGEAIKRNNGKLQAIFNSNGAHFKIELPKTI